MVEITKISGIMKRKKEGDIMSTLTRFNRYLDTILNPEKLDLKLQKCNIINELVGEMLNRTNEIFDYENLPDTIDKRILELFVQTSGIICFYEYESKLYVFTGGYGGEPNVYYEPTIFTIANPALNISKNLVIGTDCEIMRNDSLGVGLLPMFYRYAKEITETHVSLHIANINSRIISLISASDVRTIESAKEYINKICDGELSIIGESALLESLKTQPYQNAHNSITDIIELYQYYKASWYNDIGLNANYNMKRESLNSNESQLNKDSLLPLIDNMFSQRKKAIEKVNKMFNTNIIVKLNSSWEDVHNAADAETDTNNIDNKEGVNDEETTD